MTNQRPTKIAINARLLVSILLSVLVIALLATNGCGGGGGGGRQVLPGENPIGPGTGTGSGTGTGTGTGSGTGTGTGTESPSKVLADGWLGMAADNFYGAQDKFQSVTTRSDATTAEKAEGFNGLGWARAKANGLVTGMSDFTQAGSLVEAELGMASALIQRAQLDDVKQAVTLFETIQLGAPSFVLTVTHAAIGISKCRSARDAGLRILLARGFRRRHQGEGSDQRGPTAGFIEHITCRADLQPVEKIGAGRNLIHLIPSL